MTQKLLAAALMFTTAGVAHAQDPGQNPLFAPAAPANTVEFQLSADQQSLRDRSMNDKFQIMIGDREVELGMTLECQAGSSAWLGLARRDESCVLGGKGVVKNPSNPSQKLPRAQFSGGYTINGKQNGFTDATAMRVSYLALGSVPASNGSFGGSLKMLPEDPPKGAAELQAMLMQQLSKQAAGGGEGVVVNDAIDSVAFEGFSTPSAGLPSDPGCTWNGDMIYAYATESWVMNLTARCGSETITLQGNMPWFDVKADDHNAEYVLTLTKPVAGSAGDAGLFTTASSADNALFAAADGITGTIKMKQLDKVKVEIEPGVFDDVPTRLTATATLTGTNVPLTMVRSFGILMGVLARTFFGA